MPANHANHSIKQVLALTLASTAVAAAAQVGAQPAAARDRALPVCASGDQPGYPEAVPPILPPIRCSDLPAIRRAEARKSAAFRYRLPADAPWSDAEMNAYASGGGSGS